MRLGEIIQMELNRQGINQSNLSDRSGVNRATVYRIVSGEIQSPRLEVIQKIAKGLKVSIDYLASGNKKYEDKTTYEKLSSEDDNMISCIKINIDDLKQLTNFTDKKHLMSYKVIDNSMSPTFNIGDWLLIDKGINKIDQDGVYLADYNNKQYIRRFQLSLENTLKMKSDNSNYETEVFTNEMIMKLVVLGKIIYIWNGKRA